MKTSTSCTCHTEPDACATGVLERPRYFPRQLLTPAELTLEQQYFRDKLRRHNRLLHGWGVVCGAEVCRVAPEEPTRKEHRPATPSTPNRPQPPLQAQPWKVRVKPGYVLGPYGDEIVIGCERTLDLRTHGLAGDSGERGEPVDPWCAPVLCPRDEGELYVAVRYKEIQSRPVRVQPAGCGCDETQCEYSRWRDGYEIGILDHCPASHENPPDLDDLFRGPIPACPECPAEPWVVLARVELDGDGNVTLLDNCACRRMAIGFGAYWWQCRGDACDLLRIEGDRIVEAGTDFTLEAEILEAPTNLTAEHVRLGREVEVQKAAVVEATRRIVIQGRVAATAEPGPRTLEIVDPATGRVLVARREALFVRAGAERPSPAEGESTGETEPSKPSRSRKKQEKKEK